MLLRIFLVLSILAGAGVIAITHFKVRPHIQSIIDERETQRTRAVKAEDTLDKTRKELASTKARLDRTEKDLSETTTQLTASQKKVSDLEGQNKTLKGQLDTTTENLKLARQDLEKWRQLGVTPEQVKGLMDDNKKLVAAKAVLEEEKSILLSRIKELEKIVDQITGGEGRPIVMKDGLHGKILVVDPKWDFVVLDIGEKDGARPNGVMMVSRDNKLIAKVRLVSVQVNRSIANIMGGWKLGEVMEGDEVIY